jgi:hypothetical protein
VKKTLVTFSIGALAGFLAAILLGAIADGAHTSY